MPRRLLVLSIALVLASVTLGITASAASPNRRDALTGRIPFVAGSVDLSRLPSLGRSTVRQMLFVQLQGRPVTSYAAAQLETGGTALAAADVSAIRAGLSHEQARVRPAIAATGARIQSAFTDTLNGFRVLATDRQARALARLSGVTRIYAIPLAERDDVPSADYIKATNTWTDYGLTGEGVTIAIIDSGINYYHRNFGGAGNPGFKNDDSGVVEPGTFPTAKVVGGYDFAGDNYNPGGTAEEAVPHPDEDPLDCKAVDSENVQHGSHVAGIAAGTGVEANGATFTGPYTSSAVNSAGLRIGPGIAPQAKLLAYRVFGCAGGTQLAVDAIERAVRDGADVINMSLGSRFGDPDSIDSIAANAAAEAGVVVVASAGNDGPGAYITGSPGSAARVISVGAVSGSPDLSAGVIVDLPGAANDIPGFNLYGSQLPVSGTLHVLVDGDGQIRTGCDAADFDGLPSGSVVGIRRDYNCNFSTRRTNAENADAVGIVFLNNEPGTAVGPIPNPDLTIPTIMIDQSRGEDLKSGDGLSVILRSGQAANDIYGELGFFSSGGPALMSIGVKPDLVAPGIDVVSTDGATTSRGVSMNGTSMAAPQAAGAAALVLQAHPLYTPAHVKGVLVGSADPNAVDPYSVERGGAGALNVRKAVTAVSWAESLDTPGTSSVTFGYDAISINPDGLNAYNESQAFRLANTSDQSITYNLANHTQSPAGGFVASVPSTVTVAAHSSVNTPVRLTLTNAAAADLPGAAPNDAPDISSDGYQLFQALNDVAGVITVDPVSGGMGLSTVRVPWVLVPRATSDLRTAQRKPFSSGTVQHSSVRVKNKGVHSGNLDVFAWGLSDQNENQGSLDMRAGGVQSLPTEYCGTSPDLSDRCLIFAVNTWRPWSSPAENEFDVLIDIDRDGKDDFAVVGIEYTGFFGPDDGIAAVPISAILDLRGDSTILVDVWYAVAPPNSSTFLMPVLASELARDAAHPRFDWYAASFSFATADSVDLMLTGSAAGSGLARFNAFKDPISQGDFYSLDPGDHVDVPISVDTARYRPGNRGQKGWMFVNMDGGDGPGQARLIDVGALSQ
jgi:minor extracellular serine protease Vpr